MSISLTNFVSVRHIKPSLVALCFVAGLGIAAPQPARAACAVGVIGGAASTSAAAITGEIAAAGVGIFYAMEQMVDAIVRLANQTSVNTQSRNNAVAATTDMETAQKAAMMMGKNTYANSAALEPSIVTCGIASAQKRLGQTGTQYASYRTAMQNKGTNYSLNGPGSGAVNGTVQAMATVWKERCTKYANPDTLQLPTGGACAGQTDPELVDLDIRPWAALIDPIQYTTAAKVTGAEDAIRMLTELAPPDPLRGAALTRDEGKQLYTMRMRDVSRMNLARGVLQDIAAMRTAPAAAAAPAAGGTAPYSRMARYVELVEGRKFDVTTGQLTTDPVDIASSGEMENQALQVVAARLATQQGMMFEILRVAEQVIAIDAVELAMKVEKSRGATLSSSGRATQAN